MDEASTINSFASHSELVAITLVVVGLIGGRLASIALGRLLEALDRRVARISTTDSSVFSPRLIKISRAVVFWLVFVLGIVFALRVLGIGAMSALLIAATGFVPKALVSFTILAAGHLLGLLASKLLTELNEDIPADSIGPRLLYGTVIGIAVVMATAEHGREHFVRDPFDSDSGRRCWWRADARVRVRRPPAGRKSPGTQGDSAIYDR